MERSRELDELHKELIALDVRMDQVLRAITSQYEVGQLIKYKNNPIVKTLTFARIKKILPWALLVDRYKPDGAKMRGTGRIEGTNLCSVVRVDEVEP